MWDVNMTIIVSIVVSVICLIVKSLNQHLKKLSLSYLIKNRMQMTVSLEMARIVWRTLNLSKF